VVIISMSIPPATDPAHPVPVPIPRTPIFPSLTFSAASRCACATFPTKVKSATFFPSPSAYLLLPLRALATSTGKNCRSCWFGIVARGVGSAPATGCWLSFEPPHTYPGPEDAVRADGRREQPALAAGLQHQLLRQGLGLGVGVEPRCGIGRRLVRAALVLALVHDAGGRKQRM